MLEGVHAHDIAQGLDKRGIAVRAGHHCTMPLHHWLNVRATARASFYFYNTVAEVEKYAEALAEIRSQFAPKGRKRKPLNREED